METPTQNDFKNTVAVAKAVLSATASVTATVMVVQSVVGPLVPHEFQDFLFSGIRSFLSRFSNEMTMVIDEYDGINPNELYQAAQVFLPAKQLPSMRRVRVSKPVKEDDLTLAMDQSSAGGYVRWDQTQVGFRVETSQLEQEVRYFELTFHKKHEEVVRKSYSPFVVGEARSMKQEKKTLKLSTARSDHGFAGNYCRK